MMWTYFITGIFSVIGWVFDLMHLSPVTQIPFVDVYLVTGWGYINFLRVAVPPLGILVAGFLWALSFKVIIMMLRAVPFVGRIFSR